MKSALGAGTTFTLHLPLYTGVDTQETTVAMNVIAGQGTILVIDDEPVIRLAVRFMLEGLGYQVFEAENGQAGIELYTQHQEEIDLILLDMVMPVMDGEECFRRLKSLDSSVCVIIASGFTRDADFASIHQEGLAGFIRKPYTLEQLSSLLDQIFHQQREDSPAPL